MDKESLFEQMQGSPGASLRRPAAHDVSQRQGRRGCPVRRPPGTTPGTPWYKDQFQRGMAAHEQGDSLVVLATRETLDSDRRGRRPHHPDHPRPKRRGLGRYPRGLVVLVVVPGRLPQAGHQLNVAPVRGGQGPDVVTDLDRVHVTDYAAFSEVMGRCRAALHHAVSARPSPPSGPASPRSSSP